MTWFGVAVPAGTPESIVQILSTEITKVLNAPDVKAKLEGDVDTGSAAFAAAVKSDHVKWAGVIKDAGIQGK